LILGAARQTFAEKGYARSTTRDIAARADVAETLLFRNFGSKANLFGEAVLLPLADFFEQWLEFLDPGTDEQTEDLQQDFTAALYDGVTDHRGLLMTLFGTGVFEPEVLDGHEVSARVHQALDRLADACEERLARLGTDTTGMDVRLSARASIAMIIGVALFEEWLLPRGHQRPSRDHLVHEVSRQILYGGFNQRPADLDTVTPAKRTKRGH
jgi:AcrR family transcriptional regulator